LNFSRKPHQYMVFFGVLLGGKDCDTIINTHKS
jgi:hypothetical protein